MEHSFIITLAEHRTLGFLFFPYRVKNNPDKEYLSLTERITAAKIKEFEQELDEDYISIVEIIEEYSDTNLTRFFSKKKVNAQDFVSKLDKKLFENHVRPYIEKRVKRCLDILANTSIPIYRKESQYNIYDTDKVEFDGEAAEAVFNFETSGEGTRYFLTIRHNEKEMKLNKYANIIVDSPCCMELNNKLYVFDDIDGKKLIPFLDKPHVNIPKSAEKKYFETFVLKSVREYRVNAMGFSIVESNPKPRPKLVFEVNLAGNPVLILKFQYTRANTFFANQPPYVVVNLKEKDGKYEFTRVKRDKAWETMKITELLKKGLVNKEGANFEHPGIKELEDPEERFEEFINWLNENEKYFSHLGFEINQSLADKQFHFKPVTLKMDVKSTEDWFDVKAIVTVGDMKIPFTRFRKNILDNNREFLLPNGEYTILPKEWFARFHDLFAFGEDNDEKLKVKKHHFPILKKSVEKINKKYLEELTEVVSEKNGKPSLPEGLNAELRPYQVEGFEWMYSFHKSGMGVCLSDDMGLGKTLQTITLLKKVIDEKARKDPAKKQLAQAAQLSIFDTVVNEGGEVSIKDYVPASLIVMPSSLIHNWSNEISRFAPELRVKKYIGQNRDHNITKFDKYNLILTTYGLARNDLDYLRKYNFFYIILDESQYIKNPGSKVYQAITQLHADHKIVLTGTPIENSLTDLWSQLNFLNKGLLGNLSYFKKEFVAPIEKHQDEEKEARLKAIISPFILRRKKSEVAKDLPSLQETVIYCDMSEDQQRVYEEEKSRVRNLIMENIEQKGKEKSAIFILQALTRLRQMANHPGLVMNDFKKNSGKFDEIVSNVRSLLEEKHKVLLFSSFVKNLEMFRQYFEKTGIQYSWLSGESKNREESIRKFQEDESTGVFLISLKAGGVGLNLTSADYVFILDPWWNPAAENQAINRAHRIGQDKNVFVYRFISNDTIEQKILLLQEKKARLAEDFINDNKMVSNISVDELLELVG